MSEINGYTITKELSTENAGFCRWGFCKKNGREYFIKEFLSPVYPADDGSLSESVKARKVKICEQFFASKKRYYDTLIQCRTGNIIIPTAFFRENSHYYVITDKVIAASSDPKTVVPLSDEKKEVLIRAILYSVSAFHEKGIVHADLKPDNILLKKTINGFYTAKIIDFDSGYFVSNIPDDIQGDFVYLAPEAYIKMSGENVRLTEKTDIFALGLIFHQYWTGKLPRIGKDYQYTFETVLDDGLIEISDKIPDKIRSLISKMISKDPDDRPTAKELLNTFATDTDSAKDIKMFAGYSESAEKERAEKTERKFGFYVPQDLE